MALIILEEFTRTKKQKNKKKKNSTTAVVEPRSKRKITQTTGAQLYLYKDWHIHLDANPRADVSGNTVLGQRLTSKASSS